MKTNSLTEVLKYGTFIVDQVSFEYRHRLYLKQFDRLIRLHYYSPFFHRIDLTINAMVFFCQISLSCYFLPNLHYHFDWGPLLREFPLLVICFFSC